MKATTTFVSEGSRTPTASIKHNEYNSERPKILTIWSASGEIEIHTDEAGLKVIADAIAKHPDDLLAAARKKLEEAKKEAEKLGVKFGPDMAASEAAERLQRAIGAGMQSTAELEVAAANAKTPIPAGPFAQ